MTSPTKRTSSSSSSTHNLTKWLPSRESSTPPLISLSPSRSTTRALSHQHPQEGLEEWELNDEGDEFPSVSSGGGGKKSTAAGKFSLRRSKSGLRLFGGGGKDEGGLPLPPPPTLEGGTFPRLDRHKSTSSTSSSFFLPPTPTTATDTSFRRGSTSSNIYLEPFTPTTTTTTGRIGGWFSTLLNSSSSSHLPLDQPPPSPSTTTSPKKNFLSSLGSSTNGTSSGKNQLKPLERMIDKATAYLFDSDAHSSSTGGEIWVLGVRHDPTPAPNLVLVSQSTGKGLKKGRRKKGSNNSIQEGREILEVLERSKRDTSPSSNSLSSFSSSTSSIPSPNKEDEETYGWPPPFYRDFYSRIYLSYRTNFPLIPCTPPPSSHNGGVMGMLSMSIGRRDNGFTTAGGGGLNSDTGWGCMLRTGQSLLANALGMIVLGREWRLPLPLPSPSSPPPSATYLRLLTLFHDTPSPLSPFSIHSFASQGQSLGTPPGSWFGPSVAAGAIRNLVNLSEMEVGLRVVVGEGATVYKSKVREAGGWGGGKGRAVLVLMGLRLGIDGVNPIYFEGVKAIFRFPQSVGIAGGRPSSSYYFIGLQEDSLFYLDPHHPRPVVQTRTPSSPFINEDALKVPLGDEEKNSELKEWLEGYDTEKDWRSYHCGRVRKMGIASLDPSMLVGFMIRDEADWEDFVERVSEVARNHKPIFAIANEPPSWMLPRPTSSSALTDDSGGVESFSEGDEDWLDDRPSPPSHPLLSPSRDDDWLEDDVSPPTTRNREESEERGVLVEGEKIEFEKKEEGWEGVGIRLPGEGEEVLEENGRAV